MSALWYCLPLEIATILRSLHPAYPQATNEGFVVEMVPHSNSFVWLREMKQMPCVCCQPKHVSRCIFLQPNPCNCLTVLLRNRCPRQRCGEAQIPYQPIFSGL